MKATPNSEKLTLTFRDNQWTDQHGRRVVNDFDIFNSEHWRLLLKKSNNEWPGTYEPVSVCTKENDDDFCDPCNCEKAIRLIPPVASEPQEDVIYELKRQLQTAKEELHSEENEVTYYRNLLEESNRKIDQLTRQIKNAKDALA